VLPRLNPFGKLIKDFQKNKEFISMHKKIGITLVLVIATITLLAQPHNPPVDPDLRVPISGLEILIGAGAILGISRIIVRRGVSADPQERGDSKRSASELFPWNRHIQRLFIRPFLKPFQRENAAG
jgi:hypothetical protein